MRKTSVKPTRQKELPPNGNQLKAFRRVLIWLRCPPAESDPFGVHLRELIQVFTGIACEWEFRTAPGEEEHGRDTSRRYCTQCGKCQHAMYHRVGDVRVEWVDPYDSPRTKHRLPRTEIIKLVLLFAALIAFILLMLPNLVPESWLK